MANEIMMDFPETWEEYEQQYGFEDTDEVYTNGSRLIQSFRVKQWLDHLSVPEREKETPKAYFVDSAVSKNCKNLSESYGEICVKCNKCGRFGKG